ALEDLFDELVFPAFGHASALLSTLATTVAESGLALTADAGNRRTIADHGASSRFQDAALVGAGKAGRARWLDGGDRGAARALRQSAGRPRCGVRRRRAP